LEVLLNPIMRRKSRLKKSSNETGRRKKRWAKTKKKQVIYENYEENSEEKR